MDRGTSADMSIMYNNDSVGVHLINNKKLIDDSADVHLDSGYASAASISYNQTSTNSPSISTSNHFSLKKSLDLQTIAENYELTFGDISASPATSIIETPTTKSIRQLNAFHIQTPQIVKHMLETTPTKSNYFCNPIRSTQKSSTKKNRANSDIVWSPYKRTPNKRGSSGKKNVSFTEKLKSTEIHENTGRFRLFQENDIDSENVENSFEMSVNDQTIEFSPIGHHNKSVNAQQENRRTLKRHPSGIESSTPIARSFKRTHTQTVAKSHFDIVGDTNIKRLLRKTQSFSPAKRSATVLKEISTNFQAILEKDDEQQIEAELEGPKNNPARKMLTFSSNQFENLVNKQINSNTEYVAPTTDGIEIFQSVGSKPETSRLKRLATFKRQSKIVVASPKKTTLRNATNDKPQSMIVSPLTKANCSTDFNEMNMEISPITIECILDIEKPVNIDSLVAKNYSINSKIDLLLNKPILIESPRRNETAKQTIQENAIRRPMKKLERSTSYNPNVLTIEGRSDKEFNSIIYKHLPCTPPKLYRRRPLKRSSNVLSDQSIVSFTGPAAKRKLYDSSLIISHSSRKIFYDGFEKFDILAQLAKHNALPAIDRILKHLSDKDLVEADQVSRSWSQIIHGSYLAHARHIKYLKTSRSRKENSFSIMSNNDRFGTIGTVDQNIKRKPFSSRNTRSSSRTIVLSPPVSPSKKKFHENQKVVQKLKPGQKLARCPRCDGNSIIYSSNDNTIPDSPTKPSIKKPNVIFAKLKPYSSCPVFERDKSMVGKNTKYWRSFGDNTKTNLVISEYAECTRLACGFKFCTNCRCSQHIDSICSLRPLGSSPTSDDDYTPRSSDIRNSRRNLRRLLKD